MHQGPSFFFFPAIRRSPAHRIWPRWISSRIGALPLTIGLLCALLFSSNLLSGQSKPTEYNDYCILVKGNHIIIKMNDEVTIDEDFPDNKGKNPAPAEGIIAFQIHAGYPKMYVEFKDIKFKDLSKK